MRFKATEKQREALEVCRQHKYTLLSGGSRSGKTFALCVFIVVRACRVKGRHAILRFHFNDCKQSIGMDTLPKVLDLMQVRYTLNKADWVFTIQQTGSEIWIGGLDDKDRVEKILGKEFCTIYINEASQISYHAYQTALTRLAQRVEGVENRVFIDCNPPTRDHWLYALFKLHADPHNRNMPMPNAEAYGYLDMNPLDNVENLPDGYIDDVLSNLDERQRARFRDGEWLDRRLGSLWSMDTIISSRVPAAPTLRRIIVAVDPAVTSKEDSDETGIVVAGAASDGHIYILADYSLSASPATWGREVVEAYNRHGADCVVAEVNQGGDLVERNIRIIKPTISYKQIRATRGKALRAEPVAAMYEQGKVHHVGVMQELETQMCEWSPQVTTYSPDRLDALVWAVTELSSGKRPLSSPQTVMAAEIEW